MGAFDLRPDPDAILEELETSQEQRQGRLKILFGYAAGVGKIYAILENAQERHKSGTDVLVGCIEPHTRPETMQKLHGLLVLAPKTVPYRGIELKEFDPDEVLRRRPELVLVDEFAHTNVPDARNKKRYQGIRELLGVGIDVYTTVNVQHMESLNDITGNATEIQVQEMVPDSVFDRTGTIELVDIEPDEPLRCFENGKIYRLEHAETTMRNFFTRKNPRFLCEIALRCTTDKASFENQNERNLSDKMVNTKLLVCIGVSPSSVKRIRWMARTTEAFYVNWVALYAEDIESEQMTVEQQKTIRGNMDLAEKPDAEVINLTGHDIAATVAEHAKLSGITNIVVGKNRNKKVPENLFDINFEDHLIALLSSTEMHIIPGGAAKRAYKRPRQKVKMENFRLSWVNATRSVLVLAAATLLCFGVHWLDVMSQNTVMVYILSILLIPQAAEGYVYGVVASVISVLTFNFSFTEPYFTLNVIQAAYPLTFIITLLVALITSILTVRTKAEARLVVKREYRTEVLYEINKKFLAARGLDRIVAPTNDSLVKLFGRPVVSFTVDPEHGEDGTVLQAVDGIDATVLNTSDEKAVAHWAFLNQKCAGAGTDTLMGTAAFYTPMISQGKVLAVWGISCSKGTLDHSTRLLLRVIASQVAMALERQHLSDEQRNVMVAPEKEKTCSTPLRAIPHNLHTSLAGTLGANSAICENGSMLGESTRDGLVANIQEESQWLIHVVENLPSVMRISENASNLVKSPETVEEVVGETVSRIKQRFLKREILVRVPEEFLEAPTDGTLIVQVLASLLENAIKFSSNDSVVEVHLEKEEKPAKFMVFDHGRGISSEDFPYLFISDTPGKSRGADSSRGMGIGLSICKMIIQTHQGILEAENREGGGAVFRFTLSLKGSE